MFLINCSHCFQEFYFFIYLFLIIFACSLKTLPIEQYSSCLLSEASSANLFSGNISLPIRSSCPSIFFDDRVEILDYCLFRSYCICFEFPAGTRHPADVSWMSPKGPNVRDLQETFRGFLGDQQKIWWFDWKSVFFFHAVVFVLQIYYWFLLEKQIIKSSKWGRPRDV